MIDQKTWTLSLAARCIMLPMLFLSAPASANMAAAVEHNAIANSALTDTAAIRNEDISNGGRSLLHGRHRRRFVPKCNLCVFPGGGNVGHCKAKGRLFNCLRNRRDARGPAAAPPDFTKIPITELGLGGDGVYGYGGDPNFYDYAYDVPADYVDETQVHELLDYAEEFEDSGYSAVFYDEIEEEGGDADDLDEGEAE